MELMTRNSPPKLGGEPARTKSEQAGWFPCRYWQLREPPRPRLRSGTPPNLGGECPHSNSFTAPMTCRQYSSLRDGRRSFLGSTRYRACASRTAATVAILDCLCKAAGIREHLSRAVLGPHWRR